MLRYVVTGFLLVIVSGCAFLGDKDNTAKPVPLESIKTRLSSHKLWSHDTGKGTDQQLLKLVPAVSAGQVTVADRGGRVMAFDLDSGSQLWKTDTGAALSAGPGVGEGLALVGTSDGELIAINTTDGSIAWRVPVSSEILALPAIYAGIVVMQTVDGNVSGYDSTTGERLWVFDRTVPVLTLRGTSSPIIVDGIALIGFAAGKLAALNVETGTPLWEASISVPSGRSEIDRMVDIDADPVLRDGVLYVGSFQGELAAIDLRSRGSVLWKRKISTYSGLTVDASQLYVTDDVGNIWALESASGRSMWKQDKLQHRKVTGPVVLENAIAVGDYEGYVHLLSKQDGSLIGRFKIDSKGIQSVPVVVEDKLVVLGAGGKIAVYTHTQPDQK
ncbi:MAG: outer membrane protein assembly factor BamB [Gammaproteobacteria bacterium]